MNTKEEARGVVMARSQSILKERSSAREASELAGGTLQDRAREVPGSLCSP